MSVFVPDVVIAECVMPPVDSSVDLEDLGYVICQCLLVRLNPTGDVCRLRQFLERDPTGEDDVYQHQHALLGGIDKEVSWLMVGPFVVQLQNLITDVEREMLLEDLCGWGAIRVVHFLEEPGRLLMSGCAQRRPDRARLHQCGRRVHDYRRHA